MYRALALLQLAGWGFVAHRCVVNLVVPCSFANFRPRSSYEPRKEVRNLVLKIAEINVKSLALRNQVSTTMSSCNYNDSYLLEGPPNLDAHSRVTTPIYKKFTLNQPRTLNSASSAQRD